MGDDLENSVHNSQIEKRSTGLLSDTESSVAENSEPSSGIVSRKADNYKGPRVGRSMSTNKKRNSTKRGIKELVGNPTKKLTKHTGLSESEAETEAESDRVDQISTNKLLKLSKTILKKEMGRKTRSKTCKVIISDDELESSVSQDDIIM